MRAFDADLHHRMRLRDDRRDVSELWSACDPAGVVASAHYLATAVGVEVLRRGGNAVDAAIATSLALGVCEPAGSGLGGMAMAVVYLAASAQTFGITGACPAPHAATPEAVAKSRRYRGYRAIAVPTIAAVCRHLLERHGTMRASDLIAPAVAIAEEGFPVTSFQRDLAIDYLKPLRKGNAASLFLDPNGSPPGVGDVRRQPVLAKVLRRLGDDGFEDFYHGETAAAIVQDMQREGGFIDSRDLADADTVKEDPPLIGRLDGQPVATLGPPAGGLALLQMLQMAGELPPLETDLRTLDGIRRVAAIIRRARLDRKRYRLRVGADDPGEAAELLDRRGIVDAMKEIEIELGEAGKRTASNGETSHLVVTDRLGNVVSMTQSIERSFGACVASPELGFLYNGYLRAFKVRNERHPHYLRPGARARSNAAPTIAFRGDAPWAALGSTGSERMTSGIFEVLLRLRCGETPFDASHGPRLHCTPKKQVLLEEARFPAGTRERLEKDGYTVEDLGPYAFKMGGLQLAVFLPEGACGVAEPRRDGAAAGPGTSEL